MLHDERKSIIEDLTPPFQVLEPVVQTTPFIFCSPHSGAVYPRSFIASSKLDAHSLRKSEDVAVDRLFSGVASLGAPLLSANFPRAYLDVNREPYELDPELFGGRLPAFANTQSMRVAGGLGTIARIVADAEEIYPLNGRPSLDSAMHRIEMLYKPFHAALTSLIVRTRERFGTAVLVDCHSMPSTTAAASSGPRPDIVLGDRFGSACDGEFTHLVRDRFAARGLQVALNRPYAGGFITEHYGRPFEGVHAVQIEINRALYLNETSLQHLAGFAPLQRQITALAKNMIRDLPRHLTTRIAAE